MSTAKQLVPSLVDAQPLYWDRSYTKNMRPLRDYPTYYRQTDELAYIDGPPQEGERYNKDNIVWRVEILKDENGNNTNQFEVVNQSNLITVSSEVVSGETVYSYKYEAPEPEFTYTHTDPIDAVSIEFDQSGQRIILFESMGEIFLNWFDPVPGTIVTTNLGPGRTPIACTSTYQRVGNAGDSERFLFYVDANTDQVVARKQLDRFDIVYTLPSAPGPVTELIQAGVNLYGQLVSVACYEVDANTVGVVSFSENDSSGALVFGSILYEDPEVFTRATNLTFNSISFPEIAINLITTDKVDNTEISDFSLNSLLLIEPIVTYIEGPDLGGSSEVDTFNINSIVLKDVVVDYSLTSPDTGGDTELSSFVINTLNVYDALITYIEGPDSGGSTEVTNLTFNSITVQ